MTEVLPNLYLGSVFKLKEFLKEQLERRNKIHILSILAEEEFPPTILKTIQDNFNKITHKWIKIYDCRGSAIDFYFEEAYQFIETGIKDVVFVHCKAGLSRSPTIILSYLMKKNKLSYLDAYAFLAQRHIFDIGGSFCTKLRMYEEQLKGRKCLIL